MNAVVKTLNKYYEFTNELRTAQADNYQKKTDNIIKNLENEKKQVEAMEEKELIKLDIKQGKKSNGKARAYSIISMISNGISIVLSVLGLTNVTSFEQLFSTAANTAITLLFTFVCLTIWYISFQSGYLQKKYNKNHRKIVTIQSMIIIVSMISNYRFLNNFIQPETAFEYLYTIVFSMILDLISLNFAALSNAIKYRQYSYPDDIQENKGLIAMYIFLFINPIKVKIKKKYDEQLKEYKKAYGKESENETNNKKIIKESARDEHNNNTTAESKNRSEESDRSTAKNSNKESSWSNSSSKSFESEKDSEKSGQEEQQKDAEKDVQDIKHAEMSAECQQNVSTISAEEVKKNSEKYLKCQQDVSEKVAEICRKNSATKSGSRPYKTKENVSISQQENAEIIKKNIKKTAENVSTKSAKKSTKRNSFKYENVLAKLEELEKDSIVSAATFSLTRNDWIKIRTKLKEEQKVYTKGSFTYKQ